MIAGFRLSVAAAALAASVAHSDEPLYEVRTTIGFDAGLERNFDFDDDRRDRVAAVEGMARVYLNVLPGRPVSGLVELEAIAEREWEAGEPHETDRLLRLNQAFIRFHDVVEDTDLRLGRWLMRDQREWLFDENIDGARLILDPDDWEVELLAGRVNAVRRELFEPARRGDREWELAVIADREIDSDLYLGGYAVARVETEDDRDRPLHLGLRARGEGLEYGAWSGLSFWADAGLVRGRADRRSLRGWGFDAGVVQTFEVADHDLRLQLGYAFGSGDDGSSGADRGFRQTGLQSNEDERGALAKYKYYGEALDPELANLGVLTTGAGVTFDDTVSLDVIYHRYHKHRAEGALRDVAVSEDAELPFRDVGDAVDVVVGLRPAENVEIEAVVGMFFPGKTFEQRDDAVFARFEVEVSF